MSLAPSPSVPRIADPPTSETQPELIRLGRPEGLEATFAPELGMVCCSLRDGGAELLDQRLGLDGYAGSCGTLGLTLLHPWAGPLPGWTYSAAGSTVRLPISPLLRVDDAGRPVNGIHPAAQPFTPSAWHAGGAAGWLEATLPFDLDPRRMSVFPYPHRAHVVVTLTRTRLRIETTVEATGSQPVPVCFGWRLHLLGDRAGETTLVLPQRDEPGGRRELSAATVGTDPVSDVFALGADRLMSLAGDERLVTVRPGNGFAFAFARADAPAARRRDVTLDALTAAPGALATGGVPLATPHRPYRAVLDLEVTRRTAGWGSMSGLCERTTASGTAPSAS